MARGDEDPDFEALLAEVERTVSGAPTPAAPVPARHPEKEPPGRVSRVRTAAVAGAVGAGVVWVLFALLPFFRAGSGALGAFLATFVTVLLLLRRR